MGLLSQVFVTHKRYQSQVSLSAEASYSDGFVDEAEPGNQGWMSFSLLVSPSDMEPRDGERRVTIGAITFIADTAPAAGLVEVAVLRCGDRIYVQNRPPAYDRSAPYYGWTFVESFWAQLGSFGALPAAIAAASAGGSHE